MPSPLNTPRRYEDYRVSIICAIGFEMSAVRYMMDHEHPRLPPRQGDSNMYVLGELSGHNVVLACLPGNQGKGAAAIVATNMARTFTSIEWRFLVGIGGGVPSDKHDIRLGDVVISMSEGQYGGVVQYDLGKDAEVNFQLKGFLWPPPTMLRSAVELMRSDHFTVENKVEEFVRQMLRKGPRLSVYQRPPIGHDVLFDADYPHVVSRFECENCDQMKTISRRFREFAGPEVHYGLIASGDRVMRSAVKRDAAIGDIGDILCFEMEAAGVATEFPCIVIRGISDYADSHKNDSWQHYAAAAAAASVKELLSYVTPEQPSGSAMPASPGHAAPPNCDGPVSQRLSGQGIQSSAPFSVGRDLHIVYHNLNRDIPPQLHFRDLVVLNDALGETHCFSLSFIDSLEPLVRILNHKFQDVGSQKIDRKEWILQDHHSGRVLDLTKPWRKVVKILDMSMILRMRNVPTEVCPWCHSENDGNLDARVQWMYQRFEEINEIDICESVPQAISSLPIHRGNTEPKLPHPSPRPRPLEVRESEEDINLYTRVQIINTSFRRKNLEQIETAVRRIILSSHDLEDRAGLAEYLTQSFHGLSEGECITALTEIGVLPVKPMSTLLKVIWYCCACSFGPWSLDLDDTCMNCGKRYCSTCLVEKTC